MSYPPKGFPALEPPFTKRDVVRAVAELIEARKSFPTIVAVLAPIAALFEASGNLEHIAESAHLIHPVSLPPGLTVGQALAIKELHDALSAIGKLSEEKR